MACLVSRWWLACVEGRCLVALQKLSGSYVVDQTCGEGKRQRSTNARIRKSRHPDSCIISLAIHVSTSDLQRKYLKPSIWVEFTHLCCRSHGIPSKVEPPKPRFMEFNAKRALNQCKPRRAVTLKPEINQFRKLFNVRAETFCESAKSEQAQHDSADLHEPVVLYVQS